MRCSRFRHGREHVETARPLPAALPPLPDRNGSLPLDFFIEKHGIEKLVILATRIGQTDTIPELMKARVDARPSS